MNTQSLPSQKISKKYNKSTIKTFYSLLKGNKYPEISDKEFATEVRIDTTNYHCEGVVFRDCIFQEGVLFKSVDLKRGIRFINCSFNAWILFDESRADKIDDKFNPDNSSILFEECTEIKNIKIINCEFERSFKLSNSTVNNYFVIEKAKIDSLDFVESKLFEVDITYLNTRLGLKISNSTILGKGRYFGCTGDGFSFIDSTFFKDQYLWANTVKHITTNYGVFEDELKIKACPASENYFIYGTTFKKGVLIETDDSGNKIKADIEHINLKDCDFQAGFAFKTAKDILGKNISPNKLTLDCSSLSKGNISIENANIFELTVKGTNSSSNISFNNCSSFSVNIDRFTNLGQLSFTDFRSLKKSGSKFSIDKTILGKTILLNVSFRQFETVIIKHSQLTDIIFSDVEWFNIEQLNPYEKYTEYLIVEDKNQKLKKQIDRKKWSRIKSNREVFRQLKYASEKQGNFIQALFFKSNEMKSLKEELKCYEFGNRVGDKIMMWFNKSNEYGVNWLKPMGLLLLINILFFVGITLMQTGEFIFLPAKSFNDLDKSYDLLCENNGAFWALLNPIRRLSDIFGNKDFDGMTTFLDYFHRILISYLIFQIVSAFRKYLK
ncbi:hypothetical protein NF867_00580 [Solitalea sp. MAHUQ-68]|uniref:Pentapeptide repeat-containing protein n=1 Tax=Solitalea agri TaxID=2953739 RepID=A0A9X2JC34_9SPHI|nr:hypothetical protein [Solitalea agri]MCO4291355.1 hypothetical protein [Solitalea agri]